MNDPAFEENRYLPFNNPKEIDLTIEINNVSNYKSATITKYLSNRKYGSVYDAWIEMGMPNLNTRDKSRYDLLKGLSNPLFKTYETTIENNILKIHEHLSPFEIKTLYLTLKK